MNYLNLGHGVPMVPADQAILHTTGAVNNRILIMQFQAEKEIKAHKLATREQRNEQNKRLIGNREI